MNKTIVATSPNSGYAASCLTALRPNSPSESFAYPRNVRRNRCLELHSVLKIRSADVKIDYRKLAEEYLHIAKQIAEELRTNEDVIGCAILGSTANLLMR